MAGTARRALLFGHRLSSLSLRSASTTLPPALGPAARRHSSTDAPATVPAAERPAVPAALPQHSLSENAAARELYNRHRHVMPLYNVMPDIAIDAWVAPNATIIGDVVLEDRSTVWYGAVVRADLNFIRMGSYSSIGEKTVVHAARSSPTGLSAETTIGKYVTIGPLCTIRSSQIEDEAVIGQRCLLMEGSLVEKQAVLADGSVVPPGRRIPGGQLWSGSPARFVRPLTSDEIGDIKFLAEAIHTLSDEHAQEFLPYSTAYIEVEKLRKALSAPAPPPPEEVLPEKSEAPPVKERLGGP